MKESETSKDAADKLVKNIRHKARQTASAEEKFRTVLAGLRSEESILVLPARWHRRRNCSLQINRRI